MTNVFFTPIEDDQPEDKIKVPFLEDARADFAPYYDNRGSIAEAQAALSAEFAKLGAGIVRFREGDFTISDQVRRGYQIEFTWRGVRGRIMVAGLPIEKGVTDVKLKKAKIQALLNVRDWIKASVTTRIFSPGEHPLISHLLMKNGKTMAESALESMHLPQLPSGEEFDWIEGEVTEL